MKPYILFGAGREGKRILRLLGGDKVSFFCDNDSNLLGKFVDGIKVISYSELKSICSNHNVIIAAKNVKNMHEISAQLYEDKIPFLYLNDIAKSLFRNDIRHYVAMNRRESFDYCEELENICPYDKYDAAGDFGNYFWQDLWAAKHIFEKKPKIHFDIGSRVDGFIAHLISFGQKVKLIDVRALDVEIPNVEFVQCDATNLDIIPDESIESLSALCSLEHFGLGRYGDPIDPEGCFKCFSAIQRKVCHNGYVYISVPVGKEHLEFNAHRIFFASTIKRCFSEMDLLEYSSTYGETMEQNIKIDKYDLFTEKGGKRFGLFMFRKR